MPAAKKRKTNAGVAARSYGGRGAAKRGKSNSRGGNYLLRSWNRRAAKNNPDWSRVGWRAVDRTDATASRYGKSWRGADEQQQAFRNLDNYYGHGEYSHMKGTSMAHSNSSPFTGRGAYNSLFTKQSKNPATEFHGVTSEHGCLIVSDTEKIRDIYAPTDPGAQVFDSHTFEVNPGNHMLFPSLSQMATNFKEYEFVQLVFIYHSRINDNYMTTSASTNGNIIMATKMNSEEKPYIFKHEMENAEGSTIGAVNDSNDKTHYHGVECLPSKVAVNKTLKYVRDGSVPLCEAKNDYDHCAFQLGVFDTDESFANKIVGELSVYYRVKLKNQRMNSFYGYSIPRSLYTKSYGDAGFGKIIYRPSADDGEEVPITIGRAGGATNGTTQERAMLVFNKMSSDSTTNRCTCSGFPLKISSEYGLDSSTESSATLANMGFRGLFATQFNYEVQAGSSYAFYCFQTPCVIEFPGGLVGDFEVKVSLHGNGFDGVGGAVHQQADGGNVDSNLTTFRPQPRSYVCAPRVRGNVQLNSDMIMSQTKDDYSPIAVQTLGITDAMRRKSYNAEAVFQRVPGIDTTGTNEYSVTDAYSPSGNNAQRGSLPTTTAQTPFKVMSDMFNVETTVHVHLGASSSNLGPNVIEVMVPYYIYQTSVDAANTPVDGLDEDGDVVREHIWDTGDSAYNALYKNGGSALGTDFNMPVLKDISVECTQYNAMKSIGPHMGLQLQTADDTLATDILPRSLIAATNLGNITAGSTSEGDPSGMDNQLFWNNPGQSY